MRAGRYSGRSTRRASPARAGRGDGNTNGAGAGSDSAAMSWLLVAAADDDAGAVNGRVGLAERGDDPVTPALGGTEIDKQHLILAVIDDHRELVSAPGQISLGELAFEHRVLQVVAEPAHDLVDLGEPLVLADVVRDEERGAPRGVRLPYL